MTDLVTKTINDRPSPEPEYTVIYFKLATQYKKFDIALTGVNINEKFLYREVSVHLRFLCPLEPLTDGLGAEVGLDAAVFGGLMTPSPRLMMGHV